MLLSLAGFSSLDFLLATIFEVGFVFSVSEVLRLFTAFLFALLVLLFLLETVLDSFNCLPGDELLLLVLEIPKKKDVSLYFHQRIQGNAEV